LKLTVPVALERQGDFSQSATPIADPQKTATGATCKKINDPGCFPGNVIPANRINTDMQKLLNLLPQANFFDKTVSGGKYNFLLPLTEKNPVNQRVLRLDYNISDKWHAYFRGVDMSVKSQGNAAAFAPMVYLPNF